MIRNTIIIVTLILVALLPFVTKSHDVNLVYGIRTNFDLNYSTSKDKFHTLDLYIPKKRSGKKPPLIVWIHGGGWREGNKSDTPAIDIAREGFAVASINYRLVPESVFPAQIDDCIQAIEWLSGQGDKYGFDNTRIGVWGLSAGGHLAALVGTSTGLTQAVCDWCGPTDMFTFRRQCKPNALFRDSSAADMVDDFLGGTPEEKHDLAVAASPISFASPNDPPFLIMHSEGDPIVPFEQSKELFEALKKAKAEVQLIKIPGQDHVFMDETNFGKAIDFFQTKLNKNVK